jgi:hypothetical protein
MYGFGSKYCIFSWVGPNYCMYCTHLLAHSPAYHHLELSVLIMQMYVLHNCEYVKGLRLFAGKYVGRNSLLL